MNNEVEMKNGAKMNNEAEMKNGTEMKNGVVGVVVCWSSLCIVTMIFLSIVALKFM